MNPESWREMVERSEELSLALGNGQKVIEKNEENSFVVQRREFIINMIKNMAIF